MKCSDTQSLFTNFADNTLAREELHALTDHLIGCRACAREWHDFQQTLSIVQRLETQAPPADLLQGIHDKLAKKGVFTRAWSLVERLDFSLSIPAASAIFTIAMLLGFLLRPLPPEQTGHIHSDPVGVSSLAQDKLIAASRPSFAPNAMFALSHNGTKSNANLEEYAGITTNSNPASANMGRRLLSPDIHVLIRNAGLDSRFTLSQEIIRHNWRLNHLQEGLFLVHLPQADLLAFNALLKRYNVTLVPDAAAEDGFGQDKMVLTAVLHFK